VIRRRLVAATATGLFLGAIAALVIIVSSGDPPARRAGAVALRTQSAVLARLPLDRYWHAGRFDRRAVTAAVTPLLARDEVVQSGRVRIRYRYDAAAAVDQIERLGPRGGTAIVPGRPISSAISAPVVRQALHNDCEAAAVQVLLATRSISVDQLVLQAQLPRSGPLDPIDAGSARIWGDPDLGFVGRADGGGSDGGFGVYPGPIRSLARRRYRTNLEDLSGSAPRAVYDQVLAGHAVIAWIALSDGPFAQWRTPQGKAIRANLGEHTIVLTGIGADGQIQVVNPLEGTRESWSQARFAAAWNALGRRALAA
jgi:uncharacterized protein YvpB